MPSVCKRIRASAFIAQNQTQELLIHDTGYLSGILQWQRGIELHGDMVFNTILVFTTMYNK